MKSLLATLDKYRPLFAPGGKLEALHPLWDANDTFLFTPPTTTKGPTHVRDSIDLKRVMIMVVLALLPCVLFAIYNTGRQFNVVNQIPDAGLLRHILEGCKIVLPIIFVSYAAGGFWEVLFATIRKHEINEGFLVTGLLFPLTLPPTIPLWQVAVGISFGVVIGKEVFGGTGYNIMNPALTARAFLFFAYPIQLSGDQVWTVVKDGAKTLEGWTGATPLAIAALVPKGGDVVAALREHGYTFMSMLGGLEGGSLAETALLPILLGAVILIASGIGAWRIMAGCFLGLFLMAWGMNALPAADYKGFTQLPPHYHMVMGSFLFGAVFMATDPVSAAMTNAGKWIYGTLIGVFVVLIRVANPAYPEGVMLAILFMNVMAPTVDHFVVQAHLRRRRNYLRKFSHAKG